MENARGQDETAAKSPPSPIPSPISGRAATAVMIDSSPKSAIKSEFTDASKDNPRPSVTKKRSASPLASNRVRAAPEKATLRIKYDANTEPQPRLPWFHPKSQEVIKLGEIIITAAQNQLKGHAYQGPDAKYFISWLDSRKRPQWECSNMRIILVGRSGAGKSMLINAILEQSDLAIHGRGGKSVTYVVQVFHYTRPTQQTPFEADVIFYPLPVCLEFIIQLVAYYFEYRTMESKRDGLATSSKPALEAELEEDDPEEEDTVDEEKFSEAKSRAGSAISVFLALFPDLFGSREGVKEFLNKAECQDDPRVLDPLLGRAEAIWEELNAHEKDPGTRTFSAATASQLQRDVRPFITDAEFPHIPGTKLRCCPWPFVKIVNYWLKARALRNASMTDSPGVSDTDLSRVDETRRHILESDITVIVEDIARVASEDSVLKELDEGYRRRRSGGVILVCTYTDMLGPNDEGLRFNNNEKRSLLAVRTRKAELQEMNGGLVKERQMAISQNDHLRACAISETIDMNEQEKAFLNQQETEIRVLARNRRVEHEIKEKYRERTKDPKELPVFFVSSAEYIKHTQTLDDSNPPKMSVAATGIPALRSHLYGLPAEGRFATLEYWALTLVPSALNRLRMLATISKLDRKDKVVSACKEARKNATEIVGKHSLKFMSNPCGLIVKKLRANENVYIDKAKLKCDTWQKEIRGPTHGAILRRYGTHKTPKIEPQNWNDTFLGPVRFVINPFFNKTHDGICVARASMMAQELDATMKTLVDTILDDPCTQVNITSARDSFDSYHKDTKAAIIKKCDDIQRNLQDVVKDLHSKTTTNSPDSFFTIAMNEVYKKALDAPKFHRRKYPRGTTVHAIRCDYFKSLIAKKNGPFNTVIVELEKAFETSLEDLRKIFIKKIDNIFADIEEDATRALSLREDDSKNRKAWMQNIVEMVDEFQHSEDELRELLEECKQESTG